MANRTCTLEIRPEQDCSAGETQAESNEAATRNVVMSDQQGIKHQEPQWDNGNQQRRKAAGNVQLRIRKREIAAHQQQNSDNCQLQQFTRTVTNVFPTRKAVAQHDDTGNREPRGAHQSRRNVLNCNVNGEIGRAPENIDQAKVEAQHESRWPRRRHKEDKYKTSKRVVLIQELLRGQAAHSPRPFRVQSQTEL